MAIDNNTNSAANYYMGNPDNEDVVTTRSAASKSSASTIRDWHKANMPVLQKGEAGAFTPETQPLNVGQYFDDVSRYDEDIANIDEVIAGDKTINNLRGQVQPWYDQIGAGIAKGVVLAGTTLLDGTIGTVIGAANMLGDQKFSSFWNNPFGRAMQEVNEWSEQALPNYYTKEEEEEPWYMNILTSNFIGDKFLKNMGFTVGAFASGNIYASALNAVKAPTLVKAFTGATMSAINEGKIEALNNSKDWLELQKTQLDDKYQADRQAIIDQYSNSEMLQPMLSQLELTYNSTVAKLADDALKMGNVDLLLNMPILMASNAIQFGKMYGGGYKTARRVGKVKLKDGKYVAPGTKLGGVVQATKSALSEGTEEITQKMASEIPGIKYASEATSFYNSSIDPNAEDETLNWLKASGQGILDVVGDVNSWEEFTIGFMTGAVGMPRFRSVRSKTGGIQSPIYLEGGARGEIRDYNEDRKRANTVVDYLNERVSSPEFRNYYQGMIRHKKYQNDMDQASLNSDEFEYKNAEEAQFLSDIIMFDNADKLDDLKGLIESSYDTSPENIQSIVENTTDADGNGPFRGMSEEEIVQRVTEKKDIMLQSIDGYSKVKDQIDVMSGEILSDEQLAELTYLKTMSSNWADRFESMSKDMKEFLASFSQTVINPEDREALETLSTLPDMAVLSLLEAEDRELTKNIAKVYKTIEDSNSTDKFDILQKLDDMQRLAKARNSFNEKFNEYIQEPTKLQEKINEQTSKVAEEKEQAETKDLRESLSVAKNMQEFRDYLNKEDDSEVRQKVLDQLVQENNPLAKNYKDINNYTKQVQRALSDSQFSPQAIADAMTLFEDEVGNFETVEDLLKTGLQPNQETLFDTNMSDFDNLLRFEDANQALTYALNKVNNDEQFKKRFPKQDLKSEEKGKPNPDAPKSTQTGDSQTSTIPPVNNSDNGSVSTFEPPVGDITPQAMQEENRRINEDTSTPQSLDESQSGLRQYYYPVIPEFHIQASKEGDFRPFNIVAPERSDRPVNFDAIYNYLVNNGAFSYVNEGNLKVGDEIGFMIDPEFSNTTIFMVKGDQVVGSLPESQYVIDRYAGLQGVIDKVLSEFNQTSKDKKFVATPTTKVAKMMVGKIPVGKEERDLSNIPNVSGDSIFGIVRNGVLSTNGKLADNLVTKPQNMGSKEGRMYLLIPNAAGKYSPANVRIKHFNTTEFNPDDVTVNSTPLFKNIQQSINELANSRNEEDVSNAVANLKRSLYLGNVHIDWVSGSRGNSIRLSKVERDANGREIYDTVDNKRVRREDSRTVFVTEKWDPNTLYTIGDTIQTSPDSRDASQITNDIIKVLQDFNLPLQVNLGMLNRGGYNNMLLSSGALTSNLTDASVKGSWFTTDYINKEGVSQSAVSPASVSPQTGRKIQTPVGGVEGAVSGIPVSVDSTTYHVDLTSNTVRDDNNQIVKSYPESVMDLAYITSNFGNSQNSATMIDGIALLPNGRVINRNTGKYLTGSAAESFKRKLKGEKATPEVGSVNGTLAILDSSNDSKNPIDTLKPEYQLQDSQVGYFIIEGKLNKGYISPLGNINGIEVFMTKVPNMTKGFGNDPLHVANNDFYAVFPNGNTVLISRRVNPKVTEEEVKNKLITALNGNPQRVVNVSNEKTIIFDPQAVKIQEPITPATINKPDTQGALDAVSKIDAVNTQDDEFEVEFTLREVDAERPLWNKEKEIEWLNRVLPQLSQSDRVRIQEGLIKVAETGALAWGQFNNGIITLSDIAAEGTTYHEAFHAVFHLLTDDTMREELLKEARQTYGDLSNTQLEERMAEGFREYVMTQDSQSLGTKIINFFKNLFAKVMNWSSMKPSLIGYYRSINEGKYSNSTYKVPSLQEQRVAEGVQEDNKTFASLNQDTKEALANKGWTEEQWNSISREEREQAIRCI